MPSGSLDEIPENHPVTPRKKSSNSHRGSKVATSILMSPDGKSRPMQPTPESQSNNISTINLKKQLAQTTLGVKAIEGYKSMSVSIDNNRRTLTFGGAENKEPSTALAGSKFDLGQ